MKRATTMAVAVAMSLVLAGAARGGVITFGLVEEFSEGTPPAGTVPPPWLTVTLDDGGSPGSVTLTLAATNLTGDEDVKEWYLNLDPALDPTELLFSSPSKTGAFDDPIVSLGADQFKADGDGEFDILFAFADGEPGGRFTANDSVQYTVTGIAGLTADSFDFLSAPSGGHGPFPVAAQVRSIGPSEESGWVTVPEPATLALMGLGALGLALRRRRKRSRAMAGIQKGSKPSGPRIAVLVPLVAAVLMCLTVGVRPAGAVMVTLADLLPGGTTTSIIVEDKEFYDFGGYSSVGNNPVDPATVFVSPDFFGTEIGLQFQSASFSVSSGESQDTLFDFYVVTHGMLINDNTLRMTGAASGTGRVTVIETVRTVDDLDTLASKIVEAQAGNLNLTHHMVFPYPVSALHVSKDIGLEGGDNGLAGVSHFSQTFSQIPEPATLALMGLGALGLALRRRRK